MKKSYVKITALICALIMVAIALGGILFTFIQVNDANSEFVRKVTKTKEDFDVSRIEIERYEDIQSTLVVFNGFKYLASRTNPDIGHYGRYVYRDGTLMNTGDSTTVSHISFVIDTGEDDFANENLQVEFSEGPHVVAGEGVESISYSVYFENGNLEVVTDPTSLVIEDADLVSEEVTEEYETQAQLDIEAKSKFDELIDEYSAYDNVSAIETGLVTSHALVIGSSSYTVPIAENVIEIYEYDTYIFHPLKYVFTNYMHVYILFLVMLVVLILITILMMRRMYINRMNFEARTKNLTRSFAHELKTPLAVTQAYIENWDIVEEKDRPAVTEKISSEVDHMNKMVNTLLNISAMDSGDVELNLEKVELFEFAKACFERMKQIAVEREINVEFKKYGDEELYVMADLDMMNMVISNFLSNAIKYGKENVEVNISAQGSNVMFKITNDGETISSKDLKKIWDLFYKKDKARTDRMGSNGVGLAVNKSILELHKAKFGAESKSGETTFWFEMKKAKE